MTGEIAMNSEIKNYYNDIIKMCEVYISLKSRCEMDSPATEQEISEWENKIGNPLPSDYKEWLGMTKHLRIDGGFLELFPPVGTIGDEKICVGSVIGDGDDYYFHFRNNQFYREFDGEIEFFDSFTDLLDDFYRELEMRADSKYGDKWLKVYDELFPDE